MFKIIDVTRALMENNDENNSDHDDKNNNIDTLKKMIMDAMERPFITAFNEDLNRAIEKAHEGAFDDAKIEGEDDKHEGGAVHRNFTSIISSMERAHYQVIASLIIPWLTAHRDNNNNLTQEELDREFEAIGNFITACIDDFEGNLRSNLARLIDKEGLPNPMLPKGVNARTYEEVLAEMAAREANGKSDDSNA